ncbi:glycosyl transferase family 4-domain-containing protein [Leucosporidium creatinivorum]|uniref:UDP-N-acetylglucosamine--dolichyl-phosphate N-acetylglucosaminephosphotransferase n=1 Tax=Leucosporidium creatinivorum TaxID=106004 RepID=A0A1Y2FGC9_9BASI|nr:glycosyl transferase family 4-domain-containing protein [Leucosporidium creatinivorum]
MATADPTEPLLTLLLSLSLSFIAYALTSHLVPLLGPHLVDKGLAGRDMLKEGFKRKEDLKEGEELQGELLPEATGVIGASVYILLLSLFAPLPYLSHLLPTSLTSSLSALPGLNMTALLSNAVGSTTEPTHLVDLDTSLVFPHHSFATYLASLLSLLIATFLGFMDDLFDIRWRFKLPIPLIASVPLLVTYAAGHGITDIVLPKVFGLRELLGAAGTSGVVHLGPLYYLYMSMLSTFCTNSINILAGVNGVEVGQALLIALSISINDLLYLTFSLPSGQTFGVGLARGSTELSDRHLFSLYFMLPLVGVCAGLLRWNWYPARSFIGDTFCYFSGMAFATVGILGHFSKTLLLFFLPQIVNFIYSTPQLFGILPCPRHRLPRLQEETGLLGCSWSALDGREGRLGRGLLEVLAFFRLVDIIAHTNLTLLNLLLVLRGPMREDRLTMELMGLQAMGSAVAFAVRYAGAGWFYDGGRR